MRGERRSEVNNPCPSAKLDSSNQVIGDDLIISFSNCLNALRKNKQIQRLEWFPKE